MLLQDNVTDNGIDQLPMRISEYRYERKFNVTSISFHEIQQIVKFHPSIFSEIHHERRVNNIYFDTVHLKNFYDNIDGAADRVKVRIRWYGEMYGCIENPILEIKIKRGLVGKKVSLPIAPFTLSGETNLKSLLDSAKALAVDIGIELVALVPTLLNSYVRKYFQSCDKQFRVTLDTQQYFYQIERERNAFLVHYKDLDSSILELKYDKVYDTASRFVTSNFPFRLTKSSKYVTGVQKLLQISI